MLLYQFLSMLFFQTQLSKSSNRNLLCRDTMKAALIGVGYWGKNYLRLLSEAEGVHLKWVADIAENSLANVTVPSETKKTGDLKDVYYDENVDFAVVTTPASTHYEIVKNLLLSGKSVLVEKPLTLSARHARELVDLSQQLGQVLLTGHTFLYNDAYRYIKQFIRRGEAGTILYVYGERMGLGPIRNDASCLWDLAVHDVSMILDLINRKPDTFSLVTSNFIKSNGHIPDFASFSVKYDDGLIFSFNVSWYSPSKVRRWNIIGSKAMIVFDDVEKEYPITIKYISLNDKKEVIDSSGYYKIGDVVQPHLKLGEPLKNLLDEFIVRVKGGEIFRDEIAVDIVSLLERMDGGRSTWL